MHSALTRLPTGAEAGCKGKTMLKKWLSLLVKQTHEKPQKNGWYETSTDDFTTVLVLYWRDFEWVAAPDSPTEKEHIRQDRQWRALP